MRFRSKLALTLTAVLIAVASIACSNALYHGAVAADTGITKALHQAFLDEGSAYATKSYTLEQHRSNEATLIKADQNALALTDAIDAWHKAGNDPKTVPSIISETITALEKIVSDLPPGSPLRNSISKVLAYLQ